VSYDDDQSFDDDSSDDQTYDDDRPPRKRSSSNWIWMLVIGGIVTLGGGILACCGGLVYFGLNVTTTQVETELRDDPQLREHLGEIQSFKMNFARSVAVRDGAGGGDDIFVYDVVGSKASGEVTVHHSNAGGQNMVRSASLRLKDGTTVELIGVNAPPQQVEPEE
jgi:hypothetical protein